MSNIQLGIILLVVINGLRYMVLLDLLLTTTTGFPS